MRENQYTTYYKKRSTEELKEIILQDSLYEDEARLAAIWVLKERNQLTTDQELNEFEVLKRKEKDKKEALLQAELKSKKEEEEKKESILPELYSPVAILGFSLFFSLIFGAVLMFFNLKKLGKSSQATNVLLICIGIMLVMFYASLKFQLSQFVVLLINLGGGWFLIEFFWKKYVGIHTKFKKKPLTKAILISIAISLSIFALTYFFYKDQLPAL